MNQPWLQVPTPAEVEQAAERVAQAHAELVAAQEERDTAAETLKQAKQEHGQALAAWLKLRRGLAEARGEERRVDQETGEVLGIGQGVTR